MIKQALMGIGAFLLLAQPTVGFSTQRRLETLIYQGEEYSINACILEEYWGTVGKRPKMRILNSFVDEYEVTWKIDGEELYLSRINATSAERSATTLSIANIFPDNPACLTGSVWAGRTDCSNGTSRKRFPNRMIQVENVRQLLTDRQ